MLSSYTSPTIDDPLVSDFKFYGILEVGPKRGKRNKLHWEPCFAQVNAICFCLNRICFIYIFYLYWGYQTFYTLCYKNKVYEHIHNLNMVDELIYREDSIYLYSLENPSQAGLMKSGKTRSSKISVLKQNDFNYSGLWFQIKSFFRRTAFRALLSSHNEEKY